MGRINKIPSEKIRRLRRFVFLSATFACRVQFWWTSQPGFGSRNPGPVHKPWRHGLCGRNG